MSDPLTRPGCVAPRSSVGEGGVRWVPVPCGSSSRGCVRGCWPDPEEQRRRCILFISLFISIRENTMLLQSDATTTTARISVATIQGL